MTQPPSTSSPVPMPVGVLLGAVAAALVLAGVVVWLAIGWLGGDDSARSGFIAGTLASVIAGVASAVPLVIGARFGMMGVVGGYFAGSFVRAVVAGGLCALAIIAWKYPPVSTLLTMAVHYLAVLTAESIVVGRVLWKTPYRQV